MHRLRAFHHYFKQHSLMGEMNLGMFFVSHGGEEKLVLFPIYLRPLLLRSNLTPPYMQYAPLVCLEHVSCHIMT